MTEPKIFSLKLDTLPTYISHEYKKLINAVNSARQHASLHGVEYNVPSIISDYTMVADRSVINCAEVWAARQMIENGCKFDNLILRTYNKDGKVFNPCPNCSITFKDILKNWIKE